MTRFPARWWRRVGPDRIQCELCPHCCLVKEGRTGFCGVRRMEHGEMSSLVQESTSGLGVDPIEKKPLYHFFPGSRVLSFGTLGCTLGCDFCQNAGLSRAKDAALLRPARPEELVSLARAEGCAGVAFTYNEPIVSAEWCLEVAAACREAGLHTIAVTSGYIGEAARAEFFGGMDAANVDLKSFSDAFYRRHCLGTLRPVLETLEFLAQEGKTWLEITTLIIPGENDREAEISALAAWVAQHVGPEVPLHLSAFHPAHRLVDHPRTPPDTLRRAQGIAREQGLRHVYLGNLAEPEGGTTFCSTCGLALIQREGFRILANRLADGACPSCGSVLAGRFTGSRRMPPSRSPGAREP
jgi:pyruvate formate lyase activating enzyme